METSSGLGTTRNIRRPFGAVAAVLVVGALILAGCSGNDDGVEPVPPPPAPAEPAAPAQDEPEAAAPEPEAPAQDEPEAAAPTQPAGDPELLWAVEHEGRIDSASMHPSGEIVAIAEDATYLHQLADGTLVDAVVYTEAGTGYPDQITYDADGTFLFAGLHVSSTVVTGPDGQILLELAGGFENRVAVSNDLALLAAAERSGEIVLYDVAVDTDDISIDATERSVLPAPEDLAGAGPAGAGVVSMEFTPDASLLVVVHRDAVARAWDIASLEVVTTIELDGEGAHQSLIQISPDGSHVAGSVTVGGTQTIRVWDVDILTGSSVEPTAEFEVLQRVRDLAWSPDGSLLVVASRLGTTIWNPLAGELAYTFDEEFDATASEQPLIVEFTPDGGHVLIARGNRMVELWRLPGADELIAPERVVCEPIPLPGDVLFDTGSADLQPDASPLLDALAAELAETYAQVTFTFVGHTDSRGSAEANMQLSLARAEAVVDWFAEWTATNAVSGWELRADGRGDTDLKVTDVDSAGQFLTGAGQLNRRVEIEIEADGCA